jgi:cobalt-zinc-cadmium efflux system outer membrane protein
MFRRNQKNWLPCTLLVLAVSSAVAKQASHSPLGEVSIPALTSAAPAGVSLPTPLKQAFDAAWQRQPEAQSQQARQDAAEARKQAAESWSAEPATLELSTKTDSLNRNQGSREVVAGVTIPLWLPGERSRTGAVADAERRVATSRVLAAQLRTAANVRESYWLWERARIEHDLARERLGNAQLLAVDVAKRVKAGDLARSDQHQADGAMALAEVGLAEATGALAVAVQRLRTQSGLVPIPTMPGMATVPEPVPDVPADFEALDIRHPAVTEILDRAEVARRSAELAQVQTRANPELTLATTRARGQFEESYQQSITLGIRIPFGSDSRNQAKLATAQADAIEAEGQLRLERERLRIDMGAARVGLESARTQLNASDRRLQLARESRTFFLKSFRMGETDLPTRLRIELEAIDAERQAARARIDLAAAISALRQNLGLLPE